MRKASIETTSPLRIPVIVLIVIAVFCPQSLAASENIRVAIADDLREVTLTSSAGLVVKGASTSTHEKTLVYDRGSIGSRPVRVRSVNGTIRVNGTSYRGAVELRKKKNGLLLVINDLDLEEYLKGVVASEVPSGWHVEALKAQAVAARTYALYQKRAANGRPYHILASVSSQMYGGSSGERPSTVRAVQDTRGMVITYQRKVIPAFYHSSCGGQTEDAAELWGIDEPFLKSVDCECQELLKNSLWEKRISRAMVANALKQLGYGLHEISGMDIEAITPAGRVKDVAIRSAGRISLVSGDSLRGALGTTVIPSAFFELELLGDEAVFSGRGSGHGVGMCQWGAQEMAGRGYDFRAILLHYYPGTDLVRRD